MAWGWVARSNAAGSVTVAAQQVAVRVDAAVAEEGPDPAHVLAAAEVDLAGEDRRIAAGLGDELALRSQHVAVAPEVEARGAGAAVGSMGRRLVADAVAAEHRQAVGDGVAAVAEDPGIALALLFVLLVGRVPADGGRVEQQLGAGQRHQ